MPKSSGSFGNPEVFRIRQEFYNGVARCCLKDLWDKLNEIRKDKETTRFIRGEKRSAKGIPYDVIGWKLDRDQGAIGKWFRGESPEWSNLVMAMTVLGVNWNSFGLMPSARDRAIAGWSEALVYVKKKKHGVFEKDVMRPSDDEVAVLRNLFLHDAWIAARRTKERNYVLRWLAEKLFRDEPYRRMLKWDVEQHSSLEYDACTGILGGIDEEWGDEWVECTVAIQFQLEEISEDV